MTLDNTINDFDVIVKSTMDNHTMLGLGARKIGTTRRESSTVSNIPQILSAKVKRSKSLYKQEEKLTDRINAIPAILSAKSMKSPKVQNRETVPTIKPRRGINKVVGKGIVQRQSIVPTSNSLASPKVGKINSLKEPDSIITAKEANDTICNMSNISLSGKYMDDISKATLYFKTVYKNKLKDLPDTNNGKNFSEYLDIYENNQAYYKDELRSGKLPQIVLPGIRKLESWFVKIPEPKPVCDKKYEKEDIAEWKEREKRRLSGISGYCDPDIEVLL